MGIYGHFCWEGNSIAFSFRLLGDTTKVARDVNALVTPGECRGGCL